MPMGYRDREAAGAHLCDSDDAEQLDRLQWLD
jgi:hypothetical protein